VFGIEEFYEVSLRWLKGVDVPEQNGSLPSAENSLSSDFYLIATELIKRVSMDDLWDHMAISRGHLDLFQTPETDGGDSTGCK
jgi:hypothetical protein